MILCLNLHQEVSTMISEHSGPGCVGLHTGLHQPCPVACSVTVDVLACDLVCMEKFRNSHTYKR